MLTFDSSQVIVGDHGLRWTLEARIRTKRRAAPDGRLEVPADRSLDHEGRLKKPACSWGDTNLIALPGLPRSLKSGPVVQQSGLASYKSLP